MYSSTYAALHYSSSYAGIYGTGGLIGGFLGARLQPHLLLGALAPGLAVLYLLQVIHPQR